MTETKSLALPRQTPIKVSIGTYHRNGKDYSAELVVTADRFGKLAQQAIDNQDGRASAAGGGIVVLAKRAQPVTVVPQREDGALFPDEPARRWRPLPDHVQVPARAWLNAVELLEEVAELAKRDAPCPLCRAATGCSHDSDCLVGRAGAVAAALAGEEAAA